MWSWSRLCRFLAAVVVLSVLDHILVVDGGCAIVPVNGHVDIPSSWTYVANASFDGCSSLSTVTIPISISVIGYRAFANCTSLRTLDVPNSVVFIDYLAFDTCTSLTTVNFGNQVSELGEAVFYNCHSLEAVDLPDSLVEIPDSSFYNCWKLHSIVIPDGVKQIGHSAFTNCTSLSDVTIGSNVVEIGDFAFFSCVALRSVSLSESLVIIGRSAFTYCNLESIVFSPGVRQVGEFAFAFNAGIQRIQINSPKITFNDSAFSHCNSLDASSQVYITKRAESIQNLRGDLVYYQCSNGKCICQAGYGNGITDTLYSDTHFTCVQCRAGKTNIPLSQNECKDCGKGSYSALDGSPACTLCAAGTFSTQLGATSASVCERCALGKYTASSGSSDCQPAPPGNFCNQTGLAKYFSCEAGYHTDKYGQSKCKRCPAGRYQNETGAPTCQACAIGKWNPVEGASSPTSCHECPPGQTGPTVGLAACQLCGKDTYTNSITPKNACIECPEGMMTIGTGATVCTPLTTPCQAGSTRNVTTGACLLCDPGEYSSDGVTCTPCPYSSYSSRIGAPACAFCPAGRYGVGDSSTSTVNRSSVEKSCTLCPEGKFVTSKGASYCHNCPPGSYCRHEGMSVSNLCPIGRYTDEQCQTACKNCTAGRYQSLTGSAKCSACPNGKHNSFEGSTSHSACMDCSLGRYAREVGLANCTECSTGQFASSIGLTQCQVCAEVYGATFTSNPTKSGCEENQDLVTNSSLDVLFNGGGALYGTFSVALVFIVVAMLVQYKRVKYNGRIAKIGLGRSIGRALITGFVTGSELFLIAGIWPQAAYLGVIMLLFRLLHVGGGFLLFVCAFSQRPELVEAINKYVPYVATLNELINMTFARKNMALVCVTSLAVSLDLSMLTFLPWKESRFYKESHGTPSMEVLKFYLYLTMVHSFASVCCEITYLSTYSYPSGTNGDVANALFALNITFSLGGMFVGFVQYFLKSELLGALQREIDDHFVTKRENERQQQLEAEASAINVKAMGEAVQMQDLYSDPEGFSNSSDMTSAHLVNNPLRGVMHNNLLHHANGKSKGISPIHLRGASMGGNKSGLSGDHARTSLVIDSKASHNQKQSLSAPLGTSEINARRSSLVFSQAAIVTHEDVDAGESDSEEETDLEKRMSVTIDDIP